MTFTDADRAKAVELYERFKGAEWWPPVTPKPSVNGKHVWYSAWGDMLVLDLALSAIAWAMVERLGTINLCEDAEGGYAHWEYENGVGGNTRFLTLAAAVEKP